MSFVFYSLYLLFTELTCLSAGERLYFKMGTISWPKDPVTGKVSTTKTGKQVWIAALQPMAMDSEDVDVSLKNRAQELIHKIQSTPDKKWRHGYSTLVYEVSDLMASAGSELCLSMARSGLKALHENMVIESSGCKISTQTITGINAVGNKRFKMGAPRGIKGENPSTFNLEGSEMENQLSAWASYGCIEQDTAEHASIISKLNDTSQLIQDKIFVLLGATSELGSFSVLAQLGATMACVARPGKKMRDLIEEAKHSPCTVLLPLKDQLSTGSDVELGNSTNDSLVGADLMSDAPELAKWIENFPEEKQLVIISLAYLDGEKHVRATVGMDLICESVCRSRPSTQLAYIVSPATAHCIPKDAFLERERRLESIPIWQKILLNSGLALRTQTSWSASYSKTQLYVLNGLTQLQGPNYALAKTVQQWRAMVARANGHVVSANHGPSTRTNSMISHSQVATALEGMQYFPPLVAFDINPAKSLLAALMLWDLNFLESTANPSVPLDHPMCLFIENSVHGGIWRCPYR